MEGSSAPVSPLDDHRSKAHAELSEIRDQLNDSSLEAKQQAIRRVISAMTLGKDVSLLFPAIVQNMDTPHLELKKLVYLYVVSYAKTQPETALLAINTFWKDAAERKNPLLRGLAVRTMGCLRVKQIAQYLVEPLKEALADEDPYVKKTGVLCVAKLFDAHPALVYELGLHRVVRAMVGDGNPLVIANAICCLEALGLPLELDAQAAQRLLVALADASEWTQAVLLEAVAGRVPQDAAETERTLERVSVYLLHRNPAVVLAAAKVVLRALDFAEDAHVVRAYSRRLAPALVTLLSAEHEIRFVALKTIAVIADRRPLVLAEELSSFFCCFSDPFYVKAEKLEVLVKLADAGNIDQILHELRDYALEVDAEFVRRAVRAVGRLAVKLEAAADKCVQTLWDCLKSRSELVLQETVVVIRDVLRRYPGEYEGLLGELCAEITAVDEPGAKAALAWIVGEFVEQIDNAAEILGRFFLDGFPEETPETQLQTLTACVKLCLADPTAGAQTVLRVFSLLEDCENVDLRTRGYFYWRLLKASPEMARAVVSAARPPISAASIATEPELLELLFEHLNTLACVYGRAPQSFVRAVAAEPESEPATEQPAAAADAPRRAATQDLISDDVTAEPPPLRASLHARIPDSAVLSAAQEGFDKGLYGLQVAASFQLEHGDRTVLSLTLTNHSEQPLSGFFVKFRANSYCLNPRSQEVELEELPPGRTASARVPVDFEGQPSREPPEFPMRVHVALNSSLDIFVFHVPCALSVLFRWPTACSEQRFRELLAQPNAIRAQNALDCAAAAEWAQSPQLLIDKFAENNLLLISRQENAQKLLLNFLTRLVDSFEVPLQVLLQPEQRTLPINYLVPEPSLVKLFAQAVKFIADY